MSPSYRILASLLVLCIAAGQPDFALAQSGSGHATAQASSPSAQADALTAEANALKKMLSDPDAQAPALQAGLKAKWVEAECEAKRLMSSSLADAGLAATVKSACIARLQKITVGQIIQRSSPDDLIAGVAPAPVALGYVDLSNCDSSITFDTSKPWPKVTEKTPKSVNLKGIYRLNTNGSGAEIYTNHQVYVAFVNILRWNVALGGVTTIISPPNIDWSQFFGGQKPPSSQPPKNKAETVGEPLHKAATATADQFESLNQCYHSIVRRVTRFEADLKSEESQLNSTSLRLITFLGNVQPFALTADDVRNSADPQRVFPQYEFPMFPLGDLIKLQAQLETLKNAYEMIQTWATSQTSPVPETFKANYGGASNLATKLERWTTSSNPTTAADSSTSDSSSKKPQATPATQTLSTPPHGVGNSATEAYDYELMRVYLAQWRGMFVEVHNDDDEKFVLTYKPACGGFFGAGTSTQMQLTEQDLLNPPTPGSTPPAINIDKVVCEPTIAMSNGLGLSFLPTQTPAFVAGIKRDASGNPVLDSSGNPTIVQTLGYSNRSNVEAGYALQANAYPWNFHNWDFEVGWAVGAMLTASSGGTTTDIITGPSFAVRRRTIFVTPAYDLGLRTQYVNGFKAGDPQGNLTSPPTNQIWKSKWAVTITFPFNTGTKDTNSSGGSGTQTTIPAKTSTAPK